MRVGHAILTREYPALLRLHLAAADTYLDPMPTMVRHDGPEDGERPNRFAAQSAGCDFLEGPTWRGQKGILAGWAAACEWGVASQLDWVVVCARRWVPLWNWLPSLLAHAERTNLPTLGHALESAAGEGLGVLRNEFVALRPDVWVKTGAAQRLRERAESGPPGTVNAMHECLQAANVAAGLAPLKHHPPGSAFAAWPEAINGDRRTPPPNRTLWHFYSRPADYAAAAHRLGLTSAKSRDFAVADRGLNLTTNVVSDDVIRGFGGRESWRRDSDSSPPSDVTVLSMYTPAIASYGVLSSRNHEEYARRHGYNHVTRNGIIRAGWPASWSKLDLLLREMDDGKGPKWFFWIDADAVVTNPEVSLSRWIDDRYDLICRRDWAGLNFGVFLMQNTEASRNLLRRAGQREDLKTHALWEQEAVGQTLDQGDTGVRLLIEDRMRDFNAYPEEVIAVELREQHAWHPGDFVLHLAGRPEEYRLQVIQRVAAGLAPFDQ